MIKAPYGQRHLRPTGTILRELAKVLLGQTLYGKLRVSNGRTADTTACARPLRPPHTRPNSRPLGAPITGPSVAWKRDATGPGPAVSCRNAA